MKEERRRRRKGGKEMKTGRSREERQKTLGKQSQRTRTHARTQKIAHLILCSDKKNSDHFCAYYPLVRILQVIDSLA